MLADDFDLEVEFPDFRGISPDPYGVLLLPSKHPKANIMCVRVYHASRGYYLPVQFRLVGGRFGVVPRGAFLRRIASAPGSCCHFELYLGDRPLALFFDIDCTDPDVDEAGFNSLLSCFVEALAAVIPGARVLVLSSHGPGKFSSHLHVDSSVAYAENVTAIRPVLEDVISRSPELVAIREKNPKIFDVSIYKNSKAVRAFRLAGCAKEPGGSRVLLPDPAFHSPDSFDANFAELCMLNVSHVDLTHSKMWPGVEQGSKRTRSPSRDSRVRARLDEPPTAPARDPNQLKVLDEHVELLLPDEWPYLLRTDSSGRGVLYTSTSSRCPRHGRSHKHNHVFVVAEFARLRVSCHNDSPVTHPDAEFHPIDIVAAVCTLPVGDDIVLWWGDQPRLSFKASTSLDLTLVRDFPGALAWWEGIPMHQPRPLVFVWSSGDYRAADIIRMFNSLFAVRHLGEVNREKIHRCCVFEVCGLLILLFPYLSVPSGWVERVIRQRSSCHPHFLSGVPLLPVGMKQETELEEALAYRAKGHPHKECLPYDSSMMPHCVRGEVPISSYLHKDIMKEAERLSHNIAPALAKIDVTVDFADMGVWFGDEGPEAMAESLEALWIADGKTVGQGCAGYYFRRLVHFLGGWKAKVWNAKEERMVLQSMVKETPSCRFLFPGTDDGVNVWMQVCNIPHTIFVGESYSPYPYKMWCEGGGAQLPPNIINIFSPLRAWTIVSEFDEYLYLPYLLRYFEEINCNGNARVAEAMWALMARLLRTPDDIFQKVFLLKGKQGLGKSTFFEFFGGLLVGFGRFQITSRHLSGGRFNSMLNTTSMEVLDDGECNADWYRQTKNLCTARVRVTEAKFEDARNISHPTFYGAITNDAPTCRLDPDDRRLLAFEAYPLKKDSFNAALVDSFYLLHDLEHPVTRALAVELAHYLLVDFPLDRVPMPDVIPTALRHTLISNSFDSAERMFRRCILAHNLAPQPAKDNEALHYPYLTDQHWPRWICLDGLRNTFSHLSGGRGEVRHGADTIESMLNKYGCERKTPPSDVVSLGRLNMCWFSIPPYDSVLEKANAVFPIEWEETERRFYKNDMPAEEWLFAYPQSERSDMASYATAELDRPNNDFIPPELLRTA
jgi:hypothetical protein